MRPCQPVLECALVGALVGALAFSCYALEQQNKARGLGANRMSGSQVLWAARHLAVLEGFRLKDYLPLRATFDARKREWTVVLDHKPPNYPGSRSLVFVDDQIGKATLYFGQ